MQVVKGQEKQALSKVEQLPDKARRQSEAVASALRNVQVRGPCGVRAEEGSKQSKAAV